MSRYPAHSIADTLTIRQPPQITKFTQAAPKDRALGAESTNSNDNYIAWAHLAMAAADAADAAGPPPAVAIVTDLQIANAQRLLEQRRAGLQNRQNRPRYAPAIELAAHIKRFNKIPRAAEHATAADLPRVRVYPDITAAAHQVQHDAACRVYLIAQSADATGGGRLHRDQLNTALSGVYGQRRTRQVIAAGENIFWTIAGDYIYLRNPARVLVALGGDRLQSKPVLVPLASITGGIHEYRATAVYGAYLTGRRLDNNPISQSAIRTRIGIAESTQRTYRNKSGTNASGIIARRGILILGHKPADASDIYWRYGRSAFVFTDYLGKINRPGQSYMAKSIPSTYTATTQVTANLGRYRKLKRKLKARLTLFKNPERGNNRVYYYDINQAGRAYSRRHTEMAYHVTDSLTVDKSLAVGLAGCSIWASIPGI